MTEQTEPEDTCRPVDIGGETIRVRGAAEMSDESREALGEVIRAAKAKFTAEAPQQIGALQNRLRLAHQARRAKEHQLDDIRRALCDAGFMQDEDPYSHADLADVIRQAAPGPAATQATDDWEQQNDGTWTMPVDGGTILFTRASTPEERARFAATWKPPAAVPCFTAHPVTPDMEAPATACAVQAAEDSERAAAWSAKHCAPDARTDQLQQRIHELESHARDADRLRTDWTAMRDRAEQAEQRAERLANRLDHAQRVAIENATMYSGATRDLRSSEQQRIQLAADLQYVLSYTGPPHAHEQPGTWDGTGQPCDHCNRLEQARQHLAALNPPKEPTP